MNRLICAALALAPLTLPVSAAKLPAFDGLYRPAEYPGWSCSADQVGMDGGALAIRDGALWGVESRCDLTDPVEVRDMPGARLFTAQCAGEGETYSYRVMLMQGPDGVLYVIQSGWVSTWVPCPR